MLGSRVHPINALLSSPPAAGALDMQRLNEWLSTLLQVRTRGSQVAGASKRHWLPGAASLELKLPTAWHGTWGLNIACRATPCTVPQEKGADIYRSKGILNIAGTDDK